MNYFDCVVIGSGVAGMTAALYLKRFNLNFVILEKGAPGGLVNRTGRIDNYPGLPGIDGVSLSMALYEQMMGLGVNYKYGNVLEIREEGEYKIVKTDMEEIKCKAIIIATGRIPRELGLPNEKSLIGRGLSWCATCDGIFYKNKVVAVVGGGNGALGEAIHLANIASVVHLIHRRDEFRADEIIIDRLKTYDNIKIHFEKNIVEYKIENDKLSGIILDDGELVEVEGVFLNLGYDPDTKCSENTNLVKDNKYIIVDNKMRTNIKKIYACGDVIKKDVYQLTTAVGEAAIAASTLRDELDN